MNPIHLINLNLNVEPAYKALCKSIRWDAHKNRTADPNSPHRLVSDIYARYAPLTWTEDQPFKADWYYPELVPILLPLVNQVYEFVGATELAGVLITRIGSGREIFPHIDRGYHASTYSKYCVCLRANQQQSFCFQDTELRTDSGAVFFFDNSYSHWVLNPSNEERMSMIVCVRTPRGIHTP